jgi:prefoldin subunit 5
MTIDERLEKLAERHEALTQTVDLLAAMHQQNERRMAQVTPSTGWPTSRKRTM